MVTLRCTGVCSTLALTLVSLACGGGLNVAPGGGGGAGSPTVTSTNPSPGSTGVNINAKISAIFSTPMDPTTITGTTFTVTQGGAAVLGTVTYAGSTATFTPASDLAISLPFSASISTGAKDLAGNALAAANPWVFTTGTTRSFGPNPVDLGTAGNFVALAKTLISTVPTSALTGNIGVSPAAATYLTGFSQTPMNSLSVFSKSTQVVGNLYAADYAVPTPSNLITAVSNMQAAYTDAAGRVATAGNTNLYSGNLGGRTLAPGLYKWGSSVSIPTDVTISGGANDTWIFQMTGDLTMASAQQVILGGSAQAKNIVWQVAGQATFHANSHFEGIILSQTAITLETGSTMNGRALAQSQIALQSATITQPTQ
jgi:Ice-binding-like/Bacterial Ig-like domain